jgi:hypothetical protein
MTDLWTLTGQVRRASDGAPVQQAVVEAWDKDVRFHSLLGRQEVAADGRFTMTFDEEYFGDFGGDRRPDVFYKVLRDGALLLTTEGAPSVNLPSGQHSVVIDVPDANLEAHPASGSPVPAPAPTSNEVVLHELGTALAATLATVQRELQRYPGTAGVQIVDQFDITMPVAVRTDDLGQVLATVRSTSLPGEVLGSIRLRTRPQPGSVPAPVVASQPLDVLTQLQPQQVEELRRRRVFTVDDLQRVSSTGPGLESLRSIVAGDRLDKAIEQSELFSLGSLPPKVAEELVQADVTGPRELLDHDPKALATTLTNRLGAEVTEADIATWQADVRELMRIDLPSSEPAEQATGNKPHPTPAG